MDTFLLKFAVIMAFICILGFFNEKITKFTYEIALMLFSAVIGVILVVIVSLAKGTDIGAFVSQFQFLDIDKFLMEGVLCFMLFAGACHIKLGDFINNLKQITILSVICTMLGACFYGFILFGLSALLGLGMSLPVCLMFGSIAAPTDPIAATSILNKFGLPKNISLLIQGESLFNDGVGVALFVCFSGMVSSSSSGGFVTVMLKEIIGAFITGLIVTSLCFILYRFTKKASLRIFLSLLSVSLSYYLCEVLGFSGAIASVVCGIMFAALKDSFDTRSDTETDRSFNVFWETLDDFLNSVLYVMLGLTFARILQMKHVLLISAMVIVINLISRAGSLTVSSLFMGKLPDGYDRINFVKLFTWGGLRGGLSIALAMSTKGMVNDDIYYIILGGTYAVVFFTTVIQGLSMKRVYRNISDSIERRNAAPVS